MTNKKKRNRTFFALFLFLIIFSSILVDVNLYKLFFGFPDMLNLIFRMTKPNFAYLIKVFDSIVDTLEIALISSILGSITAIPFSLLISKQSFLNKYISNLISAFFSLLRTIPSLVWAAFLVSMFSVGKFSGIMATYIMATLIAVRLIVEYIDSISENKILSIKSTGANNFQVLKYCILPSIKEYLISIFFILLETCLRSATILGLVGAGGIGQIIWKDLNIFRYDNLATVILVLFIIIYLMDIVSLKIRNILLNSNKKINSLKEYKKYKFIKFVSNIFIFTLILYLTIKSLNINIERFILGLEQGKYILFNLFKPDFSYYNKLFLGLKESLGIAIFATIFGGLISFIMVRFASFNLNSSKITIFILKPFANIFRTFPPMIMAIIFFRGVGPGPFAGALALSLYTCGVMTKIYSENVENINKNIIDSLKSTGANFNQIYIRGIFPYTNKTFYSLLLYRMESNIRNSTILGIIGAGGIGTSLSMNIQWRNWNRVGLLLLGATVMIIFFDFLSRYLRNKIEN